jgi:hypothetical protein
MCPARRQLVSLRSVAGQRDRGKDLHRKGLLLYVALAWGLLSMTGDDAPRQKG